MLQKLCGFLFGAILSSSLAWGQGLSAINGVVTDPTGAVVPKAKITVTETATGLARATTSNDIGLYSFSALRPTTYSLAVEAAGFQQLSKTGILLQANDNVTINVKLDLGSTTQVVNVGADVQQVDTTSSTLTQVVDSSRITELPLNGRNAAQLTTLVAGAVIAPSEDANEGTTKTFPEAVTVSTNGGRANEVSYFLDEVPNIDFLSNVNLPFPMPDALQEFSVQTSNYTAEYGETSGAVVNIVTKSGTNQFHGDLFNYIRNGYFNARNYFATRVDPLHRQQFGGTIGGPILRDKVFFFFGYQGTRLSDISNGLTAFVPTNANLAGDFSNYSTLGANNPLGKIVAIRPSPGAAPYPGNQIPTTSFDPASVKLLNYLPRATGNGRVTYGQPLVNTLNEYTTKEDYAISAKDRLSARYFYDSFYQPGELVNSNLLTYADYTSFTSQNVAVSETHIFSPELLNEIRFGFEHESDFRGPPSNSPTVAQLGVPISQGAVAAIEGITTTGFFTSGSFPQGQFPRQGLTWADTIRYQAGRHSFVFGGSYEHDSLNEFTATNQNGVFSFSGNTTGVALTDYLLGDLQSFTQANGYIQANRYNLPTLFAQDSFKISPRLTLNYGFRWAPALPWNDLYHEAMAFSPANYTAGVKSIVYPNAPAGQIFSGDPGVYLNGRPSNWYDIGPRFGFAYDVYGDGKTSIRGGIGEFYDSRTPGFANNRQSQATPFSLAVTLTQPVGHFSNPYLGVPDPFPAPLPPPKTITFPSPVLVYAYNQNDHRLSANTLNWNLTLEQEFSGNVLMRLAGVFARGAHLNVNEEINPAVYIPGSTLSTTARRIYKGFAQIYENSSSGGSRYNSLQLTLQKRLSRGFTVLGNYTWSKSVDDVPTGTDAVTPDVGATYALPATMPNFRKLDMGPSEFDYQQVFTTSYVWVLPSLSGRNEAIKGLVGGWEVNGIVSLQSGAPFAVLAGVDQSMTNINYDRAVLTGQPIYSSTRSCGTAASCVKYLNTAAFALPAVGTFGTVGKATAWGPGLANWDMASTKTFPVWERTKLQFRAEYFNVFNHPSFANPALSVSGGGFGTVTALNANTNSRIAQFALKILF